MKVNDNNKQQNRKYTKKNKKQKTPKIERTRTRKRKTL